jgi:hypothetical protein
MGNETFRKAYDDAADELNKLLIEQERIEERILSLRKTMTALSTLIGLRSEQDKDLMDQLGVQIRTMIDVSLTDDIHRILTTARRPLTAIEIRAELKELGQTLAEQSNPLATIYAILNRLAESGRAHETVKEGKKAWERMTRMAEAFRVTAPPRPADYENAITAPPKKK